MPARLPTVGGDNSNWGSVLNTYLQVEHQADGTHKMGTGLVTEVVNTVTTSGASQTIPAPSTQTISDITLSANCALTLPTAVAGQSFTIVLRQDATGNRTVTWVGSPKWPAGAAPALTVNANAVDVICFLCVDGTNWLGFVSGYDLR
jgi:hypothetical protein